MTRLRARALPKPHSRWYLVSLLVALVLGLGGGLAAEPDGWPYGLAFLVGMAGLVVLLSRSRAEAVAERGDVALLQRHGLRSVQVRLKRARSVEVHGRHDPQDGALVELAVQDERTPSITVPLLRLGPKPAGQDPELLRLLADGLARSTRTRSAVAADLLRAQAAHVGPLTTSPLARLVPPPPVERSGGWTDLLELGGLLP